MAEVLISMTGMAKEEAENFLSMAGGNLDMAISLYFSLQEGSGGGEPFHPSDIVSIGPQWYKPDWYGLIWPEMTDIPESWLGQSLGFEESCPGIVQPKNGPCGVLAVVHGLVLRQCLKEGKVTSETRVTEADPIIEATLALTLTPTWVMRHIWWRLCKAFCCNADQTMLELASWRHGRDLSARLVLTLDPPLKRQIIILTRESSPKGFKRSSNPNPNKRLLKKFR